MKLDQQQIVTEAISLLNEEGLKNVTLRKLAARLSVKAPSLLWHVNDKDHLLGLMSERLFANCLGAIPECENWKEWLREFGMALWHVQSETRDIAKLIALNQIPPEVRMVFLEEILVSLEKAGLSRSLSLEIEVSVQAFVTGWTILPQQHFEQLKPEEELFLSGLDALIEGWVVKVRESQPKDSCDVEAVMA